MDVKLKIINILTEYTQPRDQFGFVNIEDVAGMILKVVGHKPQSGQDNEKVCNHKFDFGLGGKGIKTSRHCGKCDQWEDIPNEKKS